MGVGSPPPASDPGGRDSIPDAARELAPYILIIALFLLLFGAFILFG